MINKTDLDSFLKKLADEANSEFDTAEAAYNAAARVSRGAMTATMQQRTNDMNRANGKLETVYAVIRELPKLDTQDEPAPTPPKKKGKDGDE